MQAAPKAIPLDPPSQAKGEEDPTLFERKGGAIANAPAARATNPRDEIARDVLRLADIGLEAPRALLAQHGLELVRVEDDSPIPGSFWG
ncbi:MAG: hypothetical protein ACREP1_12000, partial [Rhodanobacteraceae bacterium]